MVISQATESILKVVSGEGSLVAVTFFMAIPIIIGEYRSLL